MTPENDKTMRGIFRPVTYGFDEWNDRRDYRNKYEKTFNIGGKNKIIVNDILSYVETNRNLYDDEEDVGDEESQMIVLGKYFPESKHYARYFFEATFGYGVYEGEFTSCDCCGKQLKYFNTFNSCHGLCIECDYRLENNIKNNSNILEDDWVDSNLFEGDYIE